MHLPPPDASVVGAFITGGVILGAEALENLEGYTHSLGREFTILGAMIIAWRIITAAQKQAVSRYKTSAEESASYLEESLEKWKEERDFLHGELDNLRNIIKRMETSVKETKDGSE